MIENTSQRNERDRQVARRRGVAPSQILRPHFVALARQICQWEKLQQDSRTRKGLAIGVTSLAKSAGNSTVSFNLCAALTSVTRNRILLVESDFGKPFISKRLGFSKSLGLGDVLCGEANLEESIHATPLTDIYLLGCGQKTAQQSLELPFDLLPATIDEQLDEFDHVIFDLPIADNLTACQSITPFLDGVILTVESHQIDQQGIERVRHRLENQDTEIIGVVINKA